MIDISNKTLAILLGVAMVFSLTGTFIGLYKLNSLSTTGFVTTTGTSFLNITTSASVKFVINSIDFGSGSVNTSGGNQNCTIEINGTSNFVKNAGGCINFSTTVSPYGPFFIENDGNTNLNVTISSDKNASTFIGGNVSIVHFQYTIQENESAGSACTSLLSSLAWTEINVSGTNYNICNNLSYIDIKDSLRMGVRVIIPYDAPSANNLATFTVTGTAIA